jgi:hypothetical protein
MIRAPKKSDTIEVRLPHAVKRAFMDQCHAQGRTASDVVRGFVEAHLAGDPASPPSPRLWPRLAAAAAMVGALALAMPAATASGPDLRPTFAGIDRNHDGLLTPDEFGARAQPPGRECGERHVMALPLRDGAIPHARGMRPFALSAADFSFDGADANRDGKVSFPEYAGHRLKMLRAGFDELDTNRDGGLTPREYATAWEIFRFQGDQPNLASFQELDRDGDGKVSWTEFLA